MLSKSIELKSIFNYFKCKFCLSVASASQNTSPVKPKLCTAQPQLVISFYYDYKIVLFNG
jgi:hypothetical protein